MKISEKLHIIKRLSGLTQERLAKELEVSFPTLNSWINERSQPHKKTKQRIDELYKEYTGQKIIPSDVLSAKKELLLIKSHQTGNVLKLFFERQDVYDEFMLSMTYHSNGIEGSTLSENETAQILFQNRSIPNKTLIEQMEAKNHQAAFHYLLNHLQRSNELDEALILKLHAILMNGIRDDAGFYRMHGVRIVGAHLPTANHLKVPDRMKELVSIINVERKDVILHNAEIHSHFEQIHPFSDGNGRIGRLLMIAMLLKGNFPPAIIRQEKKQLYYTFLNKAQVQGDTSLLEDFICDAVLEGFEILEN